MQHTQDNIDVLFPEHGLRIVLDIKLLLLFCYQKSLLVQYLSGFTWPEENSLRFNQRAV